MDAQRPAGDRHRRRALHGRAEHLLRQQRRLQLHSSTTYIKGVASGWGVTLANANVTLNNSTTCAGVSGFSQVTITYTFQTVIPYITSLVGDP